MDRLKGEERRVKAFVLARGLPKISQTLSEWGRQRETERERESVCLCVGHCSTATHQTRAAAAKKLKNWNWQQRALNSAVWIRFLPPPMHTDTISRSSLEKNWQKGVSLILMFLFAHFNMYVCSNTQLQGGVFQFWKREEK